MLLQYVSWVERKMFYSQQHSPLIPNFNPYPIISLIKHSHSQSLPKRARLSKEMKYQFVIIIWQNGKSSVAIYIACGKIS